MCAWCWNEWRVLWLVVVCFACRRSGVYIIRQKKTTTTTTRDLDLKRKKNEKKYEKRVSRNGDLLRQRNVVTQDSWIGVGGLVLLAKKRQTHAQTPSLSHNSPHCIPRSEDELADYVNRLAAWSSNLPIILPPFSFSLSLSLSFFIQSPTTKLIITGYWTWILVRERARVRERKLANWIDWIEWVWWKIKTNIESPARDLSLIRSLNSPLSCI